MEKLSNLANNNYQKNEIKENNQKAYHKDQEVAKEVLFDKLLEVFSRQEEDFAQNYCAIQNLQEIFFKIVDKIIEVKDKQLGFVEKLVFSLIPSELGSINVEISLLNKSEVYIVFFVETEIKKTIKKEVVNLQNNLQAKGIKAIIEVKTIKEME